MRKILMIVSVFMMTSSLALAEAGVKLQDGVYKNDENVVENCAVSIESLNIDYIKYTLVDAGVDLYCDQAFSVILKRTPKSDLFSAVKENDSYQIEILRNDLYILRKKAPDAQHFSSETIFRFHALTVDKATLFSRTAERGWSWGVFENKWCILSSGSTIPCHQLRAQHVYFCDDTVATATAAGMNLCKRHYPGKQCVVESIVGPEIFVNESSALGLARQTGCRASVFVRAQ